MTLRIALLGLLVVASLLRLHRLDHDSVWDDEARTYIACAASSPQGVLERIPEFIPANPPLDPLLRHLAMQLGGDSTWVFRLPSAIFSVLGVWCVFLLARRLFSLRIALVTAALLSIHGVDIYYAHEGRNYAILNIVVPLATLALLRALDSGSLGSWCCYALGLTACFYAHLLTIAVASTHGVFVGVILISYWRRGELPRAIQLVGGFLVSCLAAALAFLPWLLVFWKHNGVPVSWISLGPCYTPFPLLVASFGFGIGVRSVFYCLPLLGLLSLFVRRDLRVSIVPLTIVIGGAGAYLLTKSNFFHLRYVFFALPFFVMLVACGIDSLGEACHRVFMSLTWRGWCWPGLANSNYWVGAVLLVLAITDIPYVKRYYQTARDFDGDWRAAGQLVASHLAETDAVLVPERLIANFGVYCKAHVYSVRSAALVDSKEDAGIRESAGPLGEWTTLSVDAAGPGAGPALHDFLGTHHYARFWLVLPENLDGCAAPEAIGRPVQQWQLKGIKVLLGSLADADR
jgi:hypothetical protein